jgi:hypothetical protein
MSQPGRPNSAAQATLDFLGGVLPNGPCRIEAKVSGGDGMPLLCAVEAVLAGTLPRDVAQELIWLGGGAAAGSNRLRLLAFGPGNRLLAEAMHEFAA